MRPLGTTVAVVLLGTAIHLDWHFARPTHHRLSLGLEWHWVIAIPVFALAAYWVARQNPRSPLTASAGLLSAATLLGAVLEPAWEYWIEHAPWEWAFGPERTWDAVTYVVTGVAAYTLTYLWLHRRTSVTS